MWLLKQARMAEISSFFPLRISLITYILEFSSMGTEAKLFHTNSQIVFWTKYCNDGQFFDCTGTNILLARDTETMRNICSLSMLQIDIFKSCSQNVPKPANSPPQILLHTLHPQVPICLIICAFVKTNRRSQSKVVHEAWMKKSCVHDRRPEKDTRD